MTRDDVNIFAIFNHNATATLNFGCLVQMVFEDINQTLRDDV